MKLLVPHEWYTPLMWACSIGFLASMPLVLAARAHRPERIAWWLIVVLAAVLGWMTSNTYGYLEQWRIEVERDELYRNQGILAEFFVDAPTSFTLPWGWAIGLAYCVVCLGLYPIFRESVNVKASRPLVGLLVSAASLAIFSALPPWADDDRFTPVRLVDLYVLFLVCAGLSYQALQIFRLAGLGPAFAVMFVVFLLLDLALSGELRQSAIWTALMAGVFVAFWWMAIRTRSVARS